MTAGSSRADAAVFVREYRLRKQSHVALMSTLADDSCDPLDPAVIAYNHARNGRYPQAIWWATT